MVENDDVQLVESIGGIDGTPPTSDVQCVHIHGFVGASFTIVASNPIVDATTSNFAIVVSDFTKVQMQQLVAI
jgi:hypothetical protein